MCTAADKPGLKRAIMEGTRDAAQVLKTLL